MIHFSWPIQTSRRAPPSNKSSNPTLKNPYQTSAESQKPVTQKPLKNPPKLTPICPNPPPTLKTDQPSINIQPPSSPNLKSRPSYLRLGKTGRPVEAREIRAGRKNVGRQLQPAGRAHQHTNWAIHQRHTCPLGQNI